MKENSMSGPRSLGDFLRARRERLTPEEMGLPSYGRRRTPGLRREEVAQLAHIGASWYTLLEQGKVSNPSDQVLDSLAVALRLSSAERRHLHRLAKPFERETGITQEVSAGLERMVLALDPNPAFILGNGWDLLIWNKAAELVFRLPGFSKPMREKPNWLRRFLTDRVIRMNSTDWQEKAQVMIARFCADYAHSLQDLRFNELIEEFTQTSEIFRTYWPRQDVQFAVDCHKRWINPVIGDMEFEYVTLQQPDHPTLKVVIYAAAPATVLTLKGLLKI
ncbi:helix-turn-helix transcriptional regulator [Paenibacillus humicola]|uniref:helix-turn-helix transcriptional regulator n=1 Tax=Paenibacillus humicola TaxID=3110540 RepID=UPI00237BA6E0|nr:helix-turn-helix transcriptional regulator [Paenibacillus humicola]